MWEAPSGDGPATARRRTSHLPLLHVDPSDRARLVEFWGRYVASERGG